MARLPSAVDLSGPASFRTGRQYFSADTSAAGRGLAALGADIGAVAEQRKQQENTVDIARAEALKTEGLLATQNEFDVDPDYATYQDRAPKKTGDVIGKAGNVIRDSKMRERWLLGARSDAARVNDGIFDKAFVEERKANVVAFDDALETNRRIYVDPETPDDIREKAKQDIDGSIKMGLETGLLDAAEADKRRKLFVEDAEFSRAKLAIDKDPAKYVQRGPVSEGAAGQAAALLRGFEGFRSSPYWDVNANRAGYGSDTVTRADGTIERVTAGTKVSREDGERDLARRIGEFEGQAIKDVGEAAWSGLPDNVKAGLLSVTYNYGEVPGRVRDAVRSGDPQAIAASVRGLRNDNEGVNAARRNKEAAVIAGETAVTGGKMPDYVNNVSPERRADLTDYAERRYQEYETRQDAQRKAISDQTNDDFSLRIATGDIGLTQREILDNPVIDNKQKASLINSLNSKLEEVGNTAAAVQAFAAGSLQVDPYDPKGKTLVDNTYSAITKAVAPEQVQPLTEEIVRQTGTVPKQVMSNIRQGLSSNDPVQIEQAAQAAQRLSAINPAALSRREGGSEVQKAADDFDYFVNKLNLSPQDAARRLQEANDPRKVVERKAIEPAAKQFVKSLEKFDLASEFDPGMFGSEPTLGATPTQELGIKAEFMAIAEDQFYQSNGDPELAKNRAVEQMKRLYGASGLGGGVTAGGVFSTASTPTKTLMKHPPEMYWPKDMQSETGNPMQYAIDALLGDVKTQDAGATDGSIRLVTTPETDAMVKRGEVPAYAVMWTDKDGMIQTIPGKLWRPDFADVTKKAGAARAEQVGEAKQLDADIKAGRDREGSLDSFLGVTPENFLGGGQ